LCLGYNHSGLWQIPDFVGELASVCGGPEQYRAFASELAQAMRQGEVTSAGNTSPITAAPHP
jgi:hypothetical protein